MNRYPRGRQGRFERNRARFLAGAKRTAVREPPSNTDARKKARRSPPIHDDGMPSTSRIMENMSSQMQNLQEMIFKNATESAMSHIPLQVIEAKITAQVMQQLASQEDVASSNVTSATERTRFSEASAKHRRSNASPVRRREDRLLQQHSARSNAAQTSRLNHGQTRYGRTGLAQAVNKPKIALGRIGRGTGRATLPVNTRGRMLVQRAKSRDRKEGGNLSKGRIEEKGVGRDRMAERDVFKDKIGNRSGGRLNEREITRGRMVAREVPTGRIEKDVPSGRLAGWGVPKGRRIEGKNLRGAKMEGIDETEGVRGLIDDWNVSSLGVGDVGLSHKIEDREVGLMREMADRDMGLRGRMDKRDISYMGEMDFGLRVAETNVGSKVGMEGREGDLRGMGFRSRINDRDMDHQRGGMAERNAASRGHMQERDVGHRSYGEEHSAGSRGMLYEKSRIQERDGGTRTRIDDMRDVIRKAHVEERDVVTYRMEDSNDIHMARMAEQGRLDRRDVDSASRTDELYGESRGMITAGKMLRTAMNEPPRGLAQITDYRAVKNDESRSMIKISLGEGNTKLRELMKLWMLDNMRAEKEKKETPALRRIELDIEAVKQEKYRSSITLRKLMNLGPTGLTLEQIRGEELLFCLIARGAAFLQTSLKVASREDVNVLFCNIIGNALFLMKHKCGSDVIQDLLTVANDVQRRRIITSMQSHCLALAMHQYSSLCVIKALSVAPSDSKLIITNELQGHVMECAVQKYASGVLEACIRYMDAEHVQFIIEEIRDKACKLARSDEGAHLIKELVASYGSSMKMDGIMRELCMETKALAKHQLGYSILAEIVVCGTDLDRGRVSRLISRSWRDLCINKYGSAVMEKCIRAANKEIYDVFINAFLSYPDGLEYLKSTESGRAVYQALAECAKTPAQREKLDNQSNKMMVSLFDRVSSEVRNAVRSSMHLAAAGTEPARNSELHTSSSSSRVHGRQSSPPQPPRSRTVNLQNTRRGQPTATSRTVGGRQQARHQHASGLLGPARYY